MKPQQRIAIATPHARYDHLERVLRDVHGFEIFRLRHRDELSEERIASFGVSHIFFPHWSWLIPESIHQHYECVVFHMTDLPFGRGGSPLQNLIRRGIYETQLSALRVNAGLDTGPIYLKRPLSLYGSAEEIYLRAAQIMEGMISEIVQGSLRPEPQQGEPTVFPRLRPQDGSIAALESLGQVHDWIRMLDADGYPRAFIRIGHLRLEFERSRRDVDSVSADVRITIVPETGV